MQTSILCDACNTGRIVTDLDTGEMVCGRCGLVSSDIVLDSRAEWRTFESDNNKRQRVGAPSSLAFHDMGLSTIIGKANQDSSGRRLDASASSSMQRLRLWDARTRASTSTQRNLMRASAELGSLKQKLGLTDVIVEKAAYLYRKAQEKQMIRGRSINSFLAAAIYVACREMGTPKSIREISTMTEVKSKELSRCYRLLTRELDIKVPLLDPAKYVAQIANRAGISEKSKRIAITIMQDVMTNEIAAGKHPACLAASVLYVACQTGNEYRTQKNIAIAAGVSEVSMRNRIKDLQTRVCVNAMWKLV